MHIPDGFLSAPVWAGLQAVSLPSVAWAARRAQGNAGESRVPLLGVMGAFVFAAQMVNFPVAAGASGHLVGGALMAATLGPAAATVVMTAILAIQAFLFQDGGLLALGANLFNMALAGVWAGYLVFAGLGRFRRLALVLAGAVSVWISAALTLTELSLSGVPLPASVLQISFLVFALNGLLEGVITLFVFEAIERINASWVRQTSRTFRPALAALALAALVLVTAGAWFASSQPDGLEQLAEQAGFLNREASLWQAPLPDYEAAVLANPWLRKAGAGMAGLAAAFLLCLGVGRWMARPRSV